MTKLLYIYKQPFNCCWYTCQSRMNSVVFSQLAMFSMGQYLFKPDDFAFFQTHMCAGSLFDMMLQSENVRIHCVMLNDVVFLSVTVMRLTGEVDLGVRMLLRDISICNKHLRIVQRAIRRVHWTRCCSRRLALAMALHPRLGDCSLFGLLGVDIVCHVSLK